MMKRSAIILSLLLAACAHAPQQAKDISAESEAEQEAPAPEPQAEKPLNLPKQELTGQMLYEFLMGDVANQRGRADLAARIYIKLAKSTRDPRVAARAANLAYESHDMEVAIEAFNLWQELEPTSLQARQMLSTMLISGGRLDEARPHLVSMLAAYPDKVGHALMRIYPFLLRHPDKTAVFDLVKELAQPYPGASEAHLVMAQAADAAGKRDIALVEVRKARELNPGLETAALFEAQLIQRESPQKSLELLKKYVSSRPQATEVRLYYARMLLEQKQYAESRKEFQYLYEIHPESADLAFAIAMLSIEMGDLEQAETRLHQALNKGKKNEAAVYYYLGQLNEAKNNDEEALRCYQKVEEGEHVYSARLRMAALAAKAGKLEEAREYLQQTTPQNNQQRAQLLLNEAQLLREARQVEAAYQVLLQGLEKLPNYPNLLYVTAMLADQLGKHDEFEQMMRKVIELKPDNAQAYNALGYSLLDRNIRIEEGMQLVEKANELAPDDAAVIDSVGWGHYRMGNLHKSLEFLRRAYSANPDPEIAAHLGEVLWAHGEKDQAKKIWDDSLKSHPDNPVLQAVIRKFQP
ncbi:MAG: tetratricopeptide repeat protein [Gallionellaceae bacterium]|nr:tetratricopeptide repeat protein [Gallionellaceae bacterium]